MGEPRVLADLPAEEIAARMLTTQEDREYLRSLAGKPPRIGSLFSGYGGLDMGVQAVIGGSVAWHVEFADAPAKILAHHWPDVPNYGDVTTVDWSAVEPVDVLTGGFPCQDVSLAGARAGLMDGTRSGLWSEYAKAIDVLRPSLVLIENVRGLLSARTMEEVDETDSDLEWTEGGVGEPAGVDRPVLNAFGRVLGDLAELGYVGRWIGIRAADAGAPHGRYRVFILAYPAGARRGWREDAGAGGGDAKTDRSWRLESERGGLLTTQDADLAAGGEWRLSAPDEAESGRAWSDAGGRGGASAVDASGERLAQHPGGSSAEEARAGSGDIPDGAGGPRTDLDWGPYRPAIERWEAVTGRVAPSPTNPDGRDGSHRLAAEFVEWMMGLPAGHVTDPAIGLTRNDQLKALGNGVVWQQAALALSILLGSLPHSLPTDRSKP